MSKTSKIGGTSENAKLYEEQGMCMKWFFYKVKHSQVRSKVVTRKNAAMTENIGDNCSWVKRISSYVHPIFLFRETTSNVMAGLTKYDISTKVQRWKGAMTTNKYISKRLEKQWHDHTP